VGKTIMTIDEALRFNMPFGKFKGWNLLRIREEETWYWQWLESNAKGRLKEAIETIKKDEEWRKKVGFSLRRT
jgi:uncharacterized protein (DUF3820 family)